MPRRHVRLVAPDGAALRNGLDRIRQEQRVPAAFPAEVLEEAEKAAGSPPAFPHDLTHIPFFTIDPPGSCDLDQAMHLERLPAGYRVYYAIADVGSWVRPGGAVDLEAHRRGVTLYGPDGRAPLHPPVLSERAASLLPDGDRPALVWRLDLDSSGKERSVDVRRGLVRSRAKLDYPEVQRQLNNGALIEPLALLRELGTMLEQRELDRGGLSLPIPEQEVVQVGDSWALAFRSPLPVEGWNAQISLATGMAAAGLMLYGEIGVLRTLPVADPRDVLRLRRTAKALAVPWPEELDYGEFVASLDPSVPEHAALLDASTSLLRGAGYTAFDGKVPERAMHAGVAAAYAHATAPVRRLVDRYVGEVCLALCAGQDVPDWARQALPRLPAEMADADRRADAYERACLDLMEAAVLSNRVGEVFRGVLVDLHRDGGSGVVQLNLPAVRGRVVGSGLALGEELDVRLVEASVAHRRVTFASLNSAAVSALGSIEPEQVGFVPDESAGRPR